MLTAVFLTALAGAPVFGAVAASTAAKTSAPEAFVYHSTAGLSLAAVLSHFEAMDAALTGLSADYEQTMKMPGTGMNSSIVGTIKFKKPERLRIEHTRPERQTVVADGVDIWIHRHSQGQVVQSKLKDWKNSDPTLNHLLQFGSYGKMLRAYETSLSTSGARAVLLLKPKDGADFSLRFTLDAVTLFPAETELSVGDVRFTTRLSRVDFNPDFKEGEFTFVPPAGADIFRNFKPPRLQP